MQDELLALKRRLRGLPETAHKQMALRKIREAAALERRNSQRVAELTAQAAALVPYAEKAK